jgi:hypothetical protein
MRRFPAPASKKPTKDNGPGQDGVDSSVLPVELAKRTYSHVVGDEASSTTTGDRV